MEHLARYRFLVSVQAVRFAGEFLANALLGRGEPFEAIQDGTVSMIHRGTIGEYLQTAIFEGLVYGLSRDFVFSGKVSHSRPHTPSAEHLTPLVRQQFGILVHARGA